jgi:two-component system, sensor histidine kinase and response regulator
VGLFLYGIKSAFLVVRALVFYLLVAPFTIFSQRYIEDKKNMSLAQQDTAQVNVLNKLSFSIRESDPSLALEYSQQATALARKLNYQQGIGRALGNAGWIYYRRGDFVRAMENSYEAMRISERIGDKEEIARSLNNIGASFYEQQQYTTSLENFKKALGISREIKDEKSVARSLNNISFLYLSAKLSLDSAWSYADQAHKVAEKIKDKYLTSFALRTKGDVFEKRRDYQQALTHYEESLVLSKGSRNNAMINATQRRIANVYLNTGKADRAIEVLAKNVTEASLYGFKEELERSYKLLAEAYYKKGEKGLAYEFLQKQSVLHDSLFNDLNTSRLAALQSNYDNDMKQAQIELLTKESALKQEEIMRQRFQLYALIGGGTLVFLFVIVLLAGFNNMRKAKQKLELQKEELAKKNGMIQEKSEELSRLNSTKDKLFSIIGHDFRSPIQNLKSLLELFNKQNLSQQEFEHFSKDLKNKIDSLYVNMNNLLNWSVMQLQGIQTKPAVIDLGQLVTEVSDLYTESYRKKEISFTNEISEEALAFADRDHIHLILRNLISNAFKFTPQKGSVRIYSNQAEGELEISVEDSGIGIASRDFEKLFVRETLWTVNGTNNEKGLGLGLLLCKEFIEKNRGRLFVRSEVSRGTTFTFSLPCVESLKEKWLEQGTLEKQA